LKDPVLEILQGELGGLLTNPDYDPASGLKYNLEGLKGLRERFQRNGLIKAFEKTIRQHYRYLALETKGVMIGEWDNFRQIIDALGIKISTKMEREIFEHRKAALADDSSKRPMAEQPQPELSESITIRPTPKPDPDSINRMPA